MGTMSISNNENESTHLLNNLNDTNITHQTSNSNTYWKSIMNIFSSRDTRQIAPVHVRKVPVKVEPKVFFANERTFLAWIHMSLTMASISVGIVA